MTDKNINIRFCRAFRRDGFCVLTFAHIYFNDETGTPWRVAFLELPIRPDEYPDLSKGETPLNLYNSRHNETRIIGAANWQPWQAVQFYRGHLDSNLDWEAEDLARRDIRDICDHYPVYCADRGITDNVLPLEVVANFERCLCLFYRVNLRAAQERALTADCLNRK